MSPLSKEQQIHKDNVVRAVEQAIDSKFHELLRTTEDGVTEGEVSAAVRTENDLLVAEFGHVLFQEYIYGRVAEWQKVFLAIGETLGRICAEDSAEEDDADDAGDLEAVVNRMVDRVMVEHATLLSQLQADRNTVYRFAQAMRISDAAVASAVADAVSAELRRTPFSPSQPRSLV